MVASLRTLIQAREGVSWSLGLTQATVNFVTSFTDELFADGLVKKILDLINSISVKEELEKLAKGRAIGDAKHRQQIIDYINEQRSCLADCLLHWACQNPFPKDETLLLYCHLQKMKVEPVPEEGGAKSAGGVGSKVVGKAGAVGGAKEELRLDAVGVALFSTLLACFNIGDATAGMLAKSMLHYSTVMIGVFLYTKETSSFFCFREHCGCVPGRRGPLSSGDGYDLCTHHACRDPEGSRTVGHTHTPRGCGVRLGHSSQGLCWESCLYG